MDSFSTVKKAIDLEKYFRENAPGFDGTQTPVACVFHEDNSPSLSIDCVQGLFKCHAGSCGKQGDIFVFHSLLHEITLGEALTDLAAEYGVELQTKQQFIIPKELILEWHENLIKDQPRLQMLSELRGISKEFLIKAKIGWNGTRFTIPIQNEKGNYVNVRQYSNDKISKFKFVNYTGPNKERGFGKNRLYPLHALEGNDPILICEGEFDCLVARERGFNCITATGGASNWDARWNELFKGRDVIICYDNDSAGDAGAVTVAQNLIQHTKRIKIAHIPIDQKGADITDFFKAGNTVEEFKAVLDRADPYEAPTLPPRPESPALGVKLHEVTYAENAGKVCKFSARISGVDPDAYFVPAEFGISCTMSLDKLCAHCPVAKEKGSKEFKLEKLDDNLLTLIGISNSVKNSALRKIAGVPDKCFISEIEIKKNYNVQALVLVPEVEAQDVEADQSKYALLSVYHAYENGEQTISNRAYDLTGRVTADPRNQKATCIIDSAHTKDDSVETFILSAETKESLKMFQPGGNTIDDLNLKFNSICDDLEHVTQIIDRREVIKAILLTYFSALNFRFRGSDYKGWVDGLIIGDTRTGKTALATKLRKHFVAGDMGSGETASFAGLVGGLQQINGRWILNWGGIPLADKRLFIVDEASGLEVDHISHMSDLRSKGEAEIKKIKTGSTYARTRLLWLSNARSNRPLSNYPYGVQAINELMGRPEDVARFDYAIGVTVSDVDPEKINSLDMDPDYKIAFDSNIFHQAVMNAWALKIDQIVFDKEADALIVKEAGRQGETYTPECPLVSSNEQRIKIARLATSAAIFFQSTTDFKTYTVKKEHVEFVVLFLETAFRSRALHYDIFSQAKMKKDQLKDITRLIDLINPADAGELLGVNNVTRDDIEICFRVGDRKMSNDVIKTLKSCNAIRKEDATGKLCYNEPFIHWLQKRAEEAPQKRGSGKPENF